jgi:hypothetical protein
MYVDRLLMIVLYFFLPSLFIFCFNLLSALLNPSEDAVWDDPITLSSELSKSMGGTLPAFLKSVNESSTCFSKANFEPPMTTTIILIHGFLNEI